MERPGLRIDRKYRTNLARGSRACGYFQRPLPGQPLFGSLYTVEIAVPRPHYNIDEMIVIRGKEVKARGRIIVGVYMVDGTRVLVRDLSAGQSVSLDKEGVGAGIYYLRCEVNGSGGRQMVKMVQ